MKRTDTPLAVALLAALAAAALLGGCAPRRPVATTTEPMGVAFLPCPGQFVSTAGERLTLEQVVAEARGADYILLGESHDNACDHGVQARVLEALAATETPPVLGLEMVAVDRQGVLDAFGRGEVELDGLPEALDWPETWGFGFELYRPMFEVAQRFSLPVGALNVPRRIVDKVSELGPMNVAAEDRPFFPAEVVPPAPEQEAMLREAFAMHAHAADGGEAALERFFYVQSVWDSMMAERAVALNRKYGWPVVVLVGFGHVEHGWGIERRIRRLEPGARVFSVSPWGRGGRCAAAGADAFAYCPDGFDSRMGMRLEVRMGRVTVVLVERGSRAERAGLRPGDVVTAAMGRAVHALSDLHAAGVAAHEADAPLVFTLDRAGALVRADFGLLGRGHADAAPKAMQAQAGRAETNATGDGNAGGTDDERTE